MKALVLMASLLMACALAVFPLSAQNDTGVPAPPPPSSEGGPYDPQQDQGAPPPDQQGAPDQQGVPDQGAPDQSASFQTFYDNLASQGTWIQSPDYGYVWQPTINDPNWAPYTVGHWVYSDAGWTWVSDEPFGWATYHYGRWVNLDGTGWCWVPGYTWAPAWVSWRYGDDYCGWAPLPPDSFVGIDYIGNGIQITAGFHIGGDCDSYYGIGAGWYHFVPVSFLGSANYRGHYANPHDNYVIINRTTNVTNLNITPNAAGNGPASRFSNISAGGPSLALVNASSATPVQRVSLTNTSRPGGGGRLANNSLALFAPRVVSGASPAAQPARIGGSLGPATVNRGIDVTRPLAVNRNLAAPAPTAGQIQQAQLAQYSAPLHARVVTTSTSVTPVLHTPLSAMQPVAQASPVHAQNNGISNTQRATSTSANVQPQSTPTPFNSSSRQSQSTPNAPSNGSNFQSFTPTHAQPESTPTPYNPYNRQSQPAPTAPSNPQYQPGNGWNGNRQQQQQNH